MNLELFIARKIIKPEALNFSRSVIRIAVTSITLGLIMMILSVAILNGFQKEIRNKVIGFGAHIQINYLNAKHDFEPRPLSIQQNFYPHLDTIDGIRHIQVYATKLGLIATDKTNEGAVLKGIGRDYDWSFFKDKIIEGEKIIIADTGKTNDILISKHLAQKLLIRTGDKIRMYFVSNDSKRARAFHVKGIYETGLEEFDRMFIICDIRHVQRLNLWSEDMVSGFEVMIDRFNTLDEMGEIINDMTPGSIQAKTIKELYPEIFDWLELSDMNVVIILVLMIMVASITMISTLLILILERTNMIGILKSLGSRNWNIQKIFLYHAAYIIIQGLILGNSIALIMAFAQKHFKWIRLPQESYYVDSVPVYIDAVHILLINAGTLIICMLMLMLPSFLITRISPVKAIRMD